MREFPPASNQPNEKTENKKTMKAKLTTLLIAFAACTAAHADPDKDQRKGPRGPRPVPPAILEKFDEDGDGKLNEKEREAAREERQKQMEARRAEALEKFDKDGDGKLNMEERKEAMKARRAEILKRFDENGDGKLSKEERAEARKAMPQRPQRARRGPEGREGPKGGERKRRGPKGGGKKNADKKDS